MLRGETRKIRNYLGNIDKIRPRLCYRVAVVYVGPAQRLQRDIMHNTEVDSSDGFSDFLRGLGWVVDTESHQRVGGFNGSLDHRLQDRMLYFGSSSCEVAFHVLPWMPLKDDDAQQIERKRHIGNDAVHIVWCEHPNGYDVSTFVSEVTDVFIVIIPLNETLVQVQVFCRPPRNKGERMITFGPLQDGAVVRRALVGMLARETAVNAIDALRSSLAGSRRAAGQGQEGLIEANGQSHPAFFRRKQIQEMFERLGNFVVGGELCAELYR